MKDWTDATTPFGWAFAMAFLAVACWEAWRPSRATVAPVTLRWFGNIMLFVLALPIGWLVPLLSSLGAAKVAAESLGLLSFCRAAASDRTRGKPSAAGFIWILD